jgi:hypothetical protein
VANAPDVTSYMRPERRSDNLATIWRFANTDCIACTRRLFAAPDLAII